MVLKANLTNLIIGDLVLKAMLVLILTILKVKFDCIPRVLQVMGLSLLWFGVVQLQFSLSFAVLQFCQFPLKPFPKLRLVEMELY